MLLLHALAFITAAIAHQSPQKRSASSQYPLPPFAPPVSPPPLLAIHKVRLNGALVSSSTSHACKGDRTDRHARTSDADTAARAAIDAAKEAAGVFKTPFGGQELLRPDTVVFGVVAPLHVQWTFQPTGVDSNHNRAPTTTNPNNTHHPVASHHPTTFITVSITTTCHASVVNDHTNHSNIVTLVSANVSADTRSWRWNGGDTALQPHCRYTLRVGEATVGFIAGPHGAVGHPDSGWTASWTGGANTVRATVNFAPLLGASERLESAVLYASTPGTMSWAANGTRLHDSVLDPG